MAIINGNRRINPLDINRNITIGVAFPLDEVNLFKGTQTVREQIKSNLINLLLTEQGERVNEPDFGEGLKNLLFEQNINLESLRQKIITQADFYVPNIQVFDVRTSLSTDQRTLFVAVTYRSLLDNSVDAIQLNFNE